MWLFTSLSKNLHDYWCEGHWTIVIQARGFIVLRHRDDDRFFKGGGNHRGSKGLVKDWSEQTSKLISAGPQDTASNPVRSGRFPYVHSLMPGIHCAIFVRFWVGPNFSFVVRRSSCSVRSVYRGKREAISLSRQAIGRSDEFHVRNFGRSSWGYRTVEAELRTDCPKLSAFSPHCACAKIEL